MGCGGSKLDNLQAVALCRDRSQCLSEAIQLRYALADAHQAYILSLRGVGENLHLFLHGSDLLSPPSPLLSLPPQRKGDPMPPLSPSLSPPPPPAHLHSLSDSGSHLHFNSDSEYSDDDDGPLHSTPSSPLHQPTTSISFATKSPAPPAKSYEQKPSSPELVHVSEPSFYGYPHESYYGGSFFGAYPPSPVKAAAYSPENPAAPPSPPAASPWDFLNPFGALENEYPAYTPSRSSKELREEEGIPDLEDEETEVVKEAYDDQKSVAASSSAINEELNSKASTVVLPEDEDEDGKKGSEDPADKVVAPDEVPKQENTESRVVAVAVKDFKQFFDRVSDSCDEISKMLEVGKCPFHRKKYEAVSSRMRNAVVLPLSLSYPVNSESFSLDFEEETAMKSGSLSSTLLKLLIWEKKLFEEVRAEEKLRIHYEQKRRRLRRLEERGAEDRKVGTTEVNARKLSTKIRVAIKVVDSISSRISQLRDEELWPQLVELIHGMTIMWRSVMNCHKSQYSAIIESRSFNGVSSEAKAEVLKQLELSLLKWIDSFCSWFHAQRSFVKALNSWLLKSLLYEPEITADGVVPFSPGRLGAPPVFVICNQWSQAMDNISDGEVVAAMQALAASVLQLWDRERLADRQRMMANRDMDRRLRIQEREELVIHRAVDSLNRKLVMASDSNGALVYGEMVLRSKTESSGEMREELKRIFDSMERLAESSLKVYEDLCARNNEESGTRAS